MTDKDITWTEENIANSEFRYSFEHDGVFYFFRLKEDGTRKLWAVYYAGTNELRPYDKEDDVLVNYLKQLIGKNENYILYEMFDDLPTKPVEDFFYE